MSPPATQLPKLPRLPRHLEHALTTTTLQVLEVPWLRGRAGTQWIVDGCPQRQVGEGDLVQLTSQDRWTGVGRLSNVTCLEKHWVTFRISGTIPNEGVRIPIPWARLTPQIASAHARLFLSLENIPPHPAFRHYDAFRNPLINPYFTVAWEAAAPPTGNDRTTPSNDQQPSSAQRRAQGTTASAPRPAQPRGPTEVPNMPSNAATGRSTS
ncbi:hypothetical protein FOMPIDRAFT_94552 [Fomitopsis schrenkii]|uniref:Uncharacterized protein n=1 Tax=Fomitopsis schrenkii TaxID=2126942 RepID=S8DZJ6_FOMSC|nr:hypothetical protein FOMPIDRAFT_94552 [Fomitopsis schrenkii]